MTLTELEERWKTIPLSENGLNKSFRISSTCSPEIYFAINHKGSRFMVLQVPLGISVYCPSIELENLSIEWSPETRLVLISLRASRFIDLFNDLILSLYNRIKNIKNASEYTKEFIASFHKWSDFFNDTYSNQLSEAEAKGVFGELLILKDCIEKAQPADYDEKLKAWQGPYNSSQDFIFTSYNLEVKTKDLDQVTVRISSEFQLDSEPGKGIQLAVVDVVRDESGLNLQNLIHELKEIISAKGGDTAILMKALFKAGLGGNNASIYNDLRWKPIGASFYDCAPNTNFPKLIYSEIQEGISRVKYNLSVPLLQDFNIQTIEF
jgi:hypothetical protein